MVKSAHPNLPLPEAKGSGLDSSTPDPAIFKRRADRVFNLNKSSRK